MITKSKVLIVLMAVSFIIIVTACGQSSAKVDNYTDATDFTEDGLASVCIEDKWGVIDKDFQLIVPPISERPIKFHNEIAVVVQGDKIGIINIIGEFIAEPMYENANPLISFQYDTQYIAVKNGEMYGLLNEYGDIVLDIGYESILPIGENVFVASKEGLVGLINVKKNIMSEFKYLGIGLLRNNRASFILNGEDGHMYGYLNSSGEEVITARYSNATAFENDFAYVVEAGLGKIIDKNGKVLAVGDFDNIYETSLLGENAIVSKDSMWGIINKNGQYLAEPEHNLIVPPFSIDDPIVIQNFGAGAGYINANGDIIVEPIYDQALPFQSNYGVIIKGSKQGIVNEQGSVILEPNYDRVHITKIDSIFILEKDDEMGLAKEAEVIFETIYDNILLFEKEEVAVLFKDYIKTLVDLEGKIIRNNIEIEEMHYRYSEGLLAVQSSGKWGFIDKTGKNIIECIYEEVGDFSNNYSKVKTTDGWTYISNPLK